MDLQLTITDPKTSRALHPENRQDPSPDTDLLESICENDHSIPTWSAQSPVTLAPSTLEKYVGAYEYAPDAPP